MSQSKLHVLQMVKEGKVSAEQGLELLDALEKEAPHSQREFVDQYDMDDPRHVRIKIVKQNDSKYVIDIPLGLVKFLNYLPLTNAKIKVNNMMITKEEILSKAEQGEKGVIKEIVDGQKHILIELI
ncbi:hypothetical protein PRVXT_000550 [Proteinivorax tanatarense]|uniref:YvlB/LiaX N-terminal domain-containing protein n=1 Tax=Proteinivorax tanatarense TaxID=1260629 RepID=A0AAU7VMY6_9FIRM